MKMMIALTAMLTATPAMSHEWYSGKHDPVTNRLCCNSHDCHQIVTDVTPMTDGGFLYPLHGIYIPPDRVQQSPDGQYHICENATEWEGWEWRCFFAPKPTT